MRSSKSRSRSKSNRNRSVGNIVNRVFDSSGPEGKVRGTPQQIIDKYTQLARDAQLANDRVATENFQQHAEHYTRMLGEAQREADARREQQEAQNRERQRERDDSREPSQTQPQSQPQTPPQAKPEEPVFAADTPQPEIASPPAGEPAGAGLDVVESGGGSDSGLVETPEEAPSKPRTRRTRKPKTDTKSSSKSKAKPDAKSDDAAKPGSSETPSEGEAKTAAE